ncbi:MAG TPA: 6-carboxytetrahydropterin synthase [Anaerolineaceae bacterium]
MYRVAVRRAFVAQHYLIGGDWGAENQRHSHHYLLELELAGDALDQHNYLVDIVEIERQVEAACAHYRDQTLNDLAEFAGQNPSVELFSRRLADRFSAAIAAANIRAVTVRLWENEIAWAAYTLER